MPPDRPMSGGGAALASPRLRALAQRAPAPAAAGAEPERCDLCGAELPGEHGHVLDLGTRELLCACRPCSLLFDRRAAGGGHLRLVPDRRLALPDFALDDATWSALRVPVDIAFFYADSAAGRVVAYYPSPMGATESQLQFAAWQEVERANPVLATLQEDVEALLVDRARGARRHWLVPIEDCYRLVAVIRTRWRGFTGGAEVWTAIERFFAELDDRARPHRRVPADATDPHPVTEGS